MKPKILSKPTISPPKPPPTPTPTPTPQNTNKNWIPLNLNRTELSLSITFPTGQTFLWKQTGHQQYTGPVGPHLVTLAHRPPNSSLSFFLHSPPSSAAKSSILSFLNSQISLRQISADFTAADPKFAAISARLGAGARVLRQPPLECLIQFLCSSNNNIARITKMVAFLSSLGPYIGTVSGFEFHQFPTLDRLAAVSEKELRDAGFGYRAKYITGTVEALGAKPFGGEEWLLSLRNLELEEVIGELCGLPGVGPKVAACVALFSLDQHHAVPVDTHVWKIGARDLLPELAGARPTPKLCSRVAEAFVKKYGKYAGWAQTLLFVAELPSQKAILASSHSEKNKKKSVKRKIIAAEMAAETLANDL